jgi:hypothetical protein
MSGHTPGPWTYEFVPEDEERDLPKAEWTGLYIGPEDETGRILHTIFEGGITHSMQDGNPELDARLISAAPDLLEALQSLMDRWEIFTGPDREGWGNMEQAYYDLAKHAQKDWRAAQAAVAKATGQDNG